MDANQIGQLYAELDEKTKNAPPLSKEWVVTWTKRFADVHEDVMAKAVSDYVGAGNAFFPSEGDLAPFVVKVMGERRRASAGQSLTCEVCGDGRGWREGAERKGKTFPRTNYGKGWLPCWKCNPKGFRRWNEDDPEDGPAWKRHNNHLTAQTEELFPANPVEGVAEARRAKERALEAQKAMAAMAKKTRDAGKL